jgi:hypothetical protein
MLSLINLCLQVTVQLWLTVSPSSSGNCSDLQLSFLFRGGRATDNLALQNPSVMRDNLLVVILVDANLLEAMTFVKSLGGYI